MAENASQSPRSRVVHGLASIGGRAATVTMRPLGGAVGAAADVGIGLERRAVDRLLENGEIERMLASPRLQAVAERALASDGARQLIDTFFDSGLLDHFLDRLGTSDGLWRLIDVIADSPAVTAAISHQGLGFADQVGDEVRRRSRRADDRLEQGVRRLVHRERGAVAETGAKAGPEAAGPPAPPASD